MRQMRGNPNASVFSLSLCITFLFFEQESVRHVYEIIGQASKKTYAFATCIGFFLFTLHRN
ncbi:hypothetical protein CN380_07740 [Bacillus sp. AFS017274]|nr:hypothetical protein CN380_07740 [Bacillus sp. AFS017274]